MKIMKYEAPTEFGKLAETISEWFAPIIRMWRFTKNNGITEGFHRKMKLIQRRAYGYRNFENYRLRVLVECGVNLWKANLKNQPIPQPLVLTRNLCIQWHPNGLRLQKPKYRLQGFFKCVVSTNFAGFDATYATYGLAPPRYSALLGTERTKTSRR